MGLCDNHLDLTSYCTPEFIWGLISSWVNSSSWGVNWFTDFQYFPKSLPLISVIYSWHSLLYNYSQMENSFFHVLPSVLNEVCIDFIDIKRCMNTILSIWYILIYNNCLATEKKKVPIEKYTLINCKIALLKLPKSAQYCTSFQFCTHIFQNTISKLVADHSQPVIEI